MLSLLPGFVVTTLLLAMLPGVGQALMLRQTLVNGRRAALASTVGTTIGLLLWSLAAAGGLSAIVLANEAAYSAMRVAGGIFLVSLGVKSLSASRHPSSGSQAEVHPPGTRGAFAAGLATNLGNPKAGVFAISLLPQFVPSTANVFLTTLWFGAVWALVTGCWYVVFVHVLSRARDLVTRPWVKRLLDITSGTCLLCLGTAVAAGL